MPVAALAVQWLDSAAAGRDGVVRCALGAKSAVYDCFVIVVMLIT